MVKFRLAVLLAERGMNQAEFSRKTKIRAATINAYYNNYIDKINKEHLNTMLNELGCSIYELIEFTPDVK